MRDWWKRGNTRRSDALFACRPGAPTRDRSKFPARSMPADTVNAVFVGSVGRRLQRYIVATGTQRTRQSRRERDVAQCDAGRVGRVRIEVDRGRPDLFVDRYRSATGRRSSLGRDVALRGVGSLDAFGELVRLRPCSRRLVIRRLGRFRSMRFVLRSRMRRAGHTLGLGSATGRGVGFYIVGLIVGLRSRILDDRRWFPRVS